MPGTSRSISGTSVAHAASDHSSPFVLNNRNCTYHAPKATSAANSTRPARESGVTYAFIVCYAALVFGRSLYLGEPLAIPLHRLESGALLLFTFFMISD